jgi:hypothetical protein
VGPAVGSCRVGSVAVYADNGSGEFTVPVRALMVPKARWQFVLLYTAPAEATDVAADGALAKRRDRAGQEWTGRVRRRCSAGGRAWGRSSPTRP